MVRMMTTRKGTIIYGKHKIQWRLRRAVGIWAVVLSMKSGKRPWRVMNIVDPSISYQGLRKFAADYVRGHKRLEQ